MKNKKPIKKIKQQRRSQEFDHLGCPSYPNCDIDPLGCIQEIGIDNVEWYGARD